MNSREIIAVLRQYYGRADQGWVLFDELRLGTGWSDGLNPTVEQRIDGWAMNTWPSRNLQRAAFEIKVTVQDFRREMAHPEKREAAKQVSTAFYFVCPAKVIWYWECPDDAGLIWIGGDKLDTIIPAPSIEPVARRPTGQRVAQDHGTGGVDGNEALGNRRVSRVHR